MSKSRSRKIDQPRRTKRTQKAKKPDSKGGKHKGQHKKIEEPGDVESNAQTTQERELETARDEALRRGLLLLKKQLSEGKITFSEHLANDFRESLGRVRYSSDGSVDLTTVDSRVRATVWGVLGIENRENQKKEFPLRDVQSTYFNFIQLQFGDLFEQMIKRGHNPQSVSTAISRDPKMVATLTKVLPDFLNTIVEFWSDCAEPTWTHIQDAPWRKAVFGGDLFPSHTRNIASTCGLYTETIILTDPFMNSKAMFSRWTPEEAARYLIKHGLNILQYRDLALAETKSPIVLIAPFRSTWDKDYSKLLIRLAEKDGLKHASIVFGRKFESRGDLFQFAGKFDTAQKIAAQVKRRERLLFDTTFTDALESQIERTSKEFGTLMGITHPGQYVAMQCMSRMMQATEIVEKSLELGGTPLIDGPTSWSYLNWKMEYGAQIGPENTPLHVMRALQVASENEIKWLGKIPPKALIELRQQGADEEIRNILSAGVDEITSANPTNFFRTTDKVVANLTDAFVDHERRLTSLTEKKWKFAFTDIGSWLVVGGIAIGAAINQDVAMGLATLAADQLLDAPRLRNIPTKVASLNREGRQLRNSPVGFLFRLSKKG